MDKPAEPARPKKRRRKRWALIVGSLLLIPVILIAMAPRLLSTPEGNQFVGSRLSKIFAPGQLKFKSIKFSWFAPTRLTNVALNDVVYAPTATISPGLWGFLVRPHELGTLTLENATFRVSRRPDGSIDLAEALSGILEARDPLRDLTILADDAHIKVNAPFWIPGQTDDSMDLLVQLRPAPQWSTWMINIERENRQSLKIAGEVDRWGVASSLPSRPDVKVVVNADHWPSGFGTSSGMGTSNDDRHIHGLLIGKCEARRKEGLWRFEGDVKAEGVSARLPHVSEGLSLGLLSANWAVGQTSEGWKVDQFDANCALGSISAEGGRSERIVGEVDLAAIAEQLPYTLRLRSYPSSSELSRWKYATGADRDRLLADQRRSGIRVEKGKARLVVQPRTVPGRAGWSVEASIADLTAQSGDRTFAIPDPATLSASIVTSDQGLALERLDLKTSFLDASVHGDTERGWNLEGNLDLGAVQRQATDWIDLRGVKLGGRSRLHGSAHYVGSEFEGDFGIDLNQTDCFGMKLDAMSLVLRAQGKKFKIDPIETKLNGGRLHVEPQIDLEAKDGPVVRLGRESTLEGAVVNEEVSTRVLSYVAPVLNQTTQASGRVSVVLDKAEFPIGGPPGRKANVTGKVVFQDVEFAPSPIMRMLVGVVSAEEPKSIRLDEPVLLSIADGRVNQRGLAIPIAGVTRLEVEGWVDFDRNMNLVATLPMTRDMLGGQTIASNLLAGAKVKLSITGTLANPKLDRENFRNNLAEVRDTLLTNVAGTGATEILRLLTKPRDPNAPPPPTAEERKAKRLEKRNDRQRARGLDPLPQPQEKP
jgi:hypothetical protein